METYFTYEFISHPNKLDKAQLQDKYKIFLIEKERQSDKDYYERLKSRFFEKVMEFEIVELLEFLEYHYENCQGIEKSFLKEIDAIIGGGEKKVTVLTWKYEDKEQQIKTWIFEKSAELNIVDKFLKQELSTSDSFDTWPVSHRVLALHYLGIIDYLKKEYPQLNIDANTKLSNLIAPIIVGKAGTIRKTLTYLVDKKHIKSPESEQAVNKVKSELTLLGIHPEKLSYLD